MKSNRDQRKSEGSSARNEMADKIDVVLSGCNTDPENEIVINEGEVFQHVKDYGIGIDCLFD